MGVPPPPGIERGLFLINKDTKTDISYFPLTDPSFIASKNMSASSPNAFPGRESNLGMC
jgi:hypothetical protein